MAVAFDAVTTGTGLASPISISHTASGSNRLVVACMAFEKASTAISGTPTYGGVNMTLLTRFVPVNNEGAVEVWYLVAPATGAQTFSASYTASGDNHVTGIRSFTGVDQTTPLSGTATAEGSSTTPSVNVASAVNDMVADVVGHVAGTFTPGAGQTEDWDVSEANVVSCAGSREAGAATVTMSHTHTANNKWRQVGFNIKAAAAGGSVVPQAMHQYRQRRVA